MQTFLPYPDFEKSASVLDRARLGKQRVEGYQILRTLLGETESWKNHPAVKMWKGYEGSLAAYTLAIIAEWKARGYNDNLEDKIWNLAVQYFLDVTEDPPFWLVDTNFLRSHQSNLLRKDPDWYSQFGWNVEPNLPYFWPTKEGY